MNLAALQATLDTLTDYTAQWGTYLDAKATSAYAERAKHPGDSNKRVRETREPSAHLKPIPIYDVNNTSNYPLLMAGDLLATGDGATTPLLALGAFE